MADRSQGNGSKANHQRLKCKSCESLMHTECNSIPDDEYELLKISNDPWICLVCNLSDNLDRVPSTQWDNTELRYINQNNSMNANLLSVSMKYYLQMKSTLKSPVNEVIDISQVTLLSSMRMSLGLTQNMTIFMSFYRVSPKNRSSGIHRDFRKIDIPYLYWNSRSTIFRSALNSRVLNSRTKN